MVHQYLPRPRSVLSLVVVTILFATTTLVWLHLDRTPPNWDDASYLTSSLALYDTLTSDGAIAYAARVESAFKSRAPLIAVLPTPLYLVFGRNWRAAYLVNIASMLLLFTVVYDLARRWWSTRAALFAILIAGTMPLLYGLAGWFMVEYALTAVVAAAVWLLAESDGMSRRGVVFLFGAVCGIGLLLKAGFAGFILCPFLYCWIRSRRRFAVLLYVSVPCLLLALPWYAFHFRSVLRFALAAGFEKSVAVYGTGPIFSVHTIAKYLSNVVREAISGYYAGLAVLLGGWTVWRWKAQARPREDGRTLETRLLLFWLLPFVIYLFGQNKDVRLIAPILPAFALLLASLLDSALPRRRFGTALACAAFAFPFLQMFSISFGAPFNAAELQYARRFHRSAWPLDDILNTISANAHIGPGEPQHVLVGSDLATLNSDNLALTAVAGRFPFQVETAAHVQDLSRLLLGLGQASFFVFKEGGEPELAAFNPYFERLVRRVRDDGQFSELSSGWPWPDGGVVRVFKNLALPSWPRCRAYFSSGMDQPRDVEITLGDMLALRGLSVSRTADWLDVHYRWQCLKPPDREYKCFTHVLDSDAKIIGQLDHYLLDGNPPIRSWARNDEALEDMRFRIPPESSGKPIQLRIGLFDPRSGARVRVEIRGSGTGSRLSPVDEGTALLSSAIGVTAAATQLTSPD